MNSVRGLGRCLRFRRGAFDHAIALPSAMLDLSFYDIPGFEEFETFLARPGGLRLSAMGSFGP